MRGVNGSGDEEESALWPGSFFCSGVRIDEISPSTAVELLCESRYGTAVRVHLCNAYTLSLALRDVDYRRMLNKSDLNFADGHYVAMVGRWRGTRVMTERVYGPALMLNTIDAGRVTGLRHFLYGSSPETVHLLAKTIDERYPGVEIVGVESPPFRALTPEDEEALFQRVRDAKPDVFWVGLGTPRQDEFVARYAERLACTVVPVGAAFDFNSGAKPSAPAVAQRFGMEWAFRLAVEPVRLWRRYVFGIPIFVLGVVTDRWFRSRPVRTRSKRRAPDPPTEVNPTSADRSLHAVVDSNKPPNGDVYEPYMVNVQR
jgi:N-acetylglucosaminyldiphosphoundecaprenol N-acetyl-beta-D-mannosaminyltransferase